MSQPQPGVQAALGIASLIMAVLFFALGNPVMGVLSMAGATAALITAAVRSASK